MALVLKFFLLISNQIVVLAILLFCSASQAAIFIQTKQKTFLYLNASKSAKKITLLKVGVKGIAKKLSSNKKWIFMKTSRGSGWVHSSRVKKYVLKHKRKAKTEPLDIELGSDAGLVSDDSSGVEGKSLSVHFYAGLSQWQHDFTLISKLSQDKVSLTQHNLGLSLGVQWRIFFKKQYLNLAAALDILSSDTGIAAEDIDQTSSTYRAKKASGFALTFKPSYQFWLYDNSVSIGPAFPVILNISQIPSIPNYEIEEGAVNFGFSYGLDVYVFVEKYGIGLFSGFIHPYPSMHTSLNFMFKF